MKIKNIVLENFRPFEGTHNVSFSTDRSKNVTLIRANNNTGKTSLFEAIKWCFYGHLPDLKDRGPIINKTVLKKLKELKSFHVSVTIDFEHDSVTYRMIRQSRISPGIDFNNPPSTFYISGVDKNGKSVKLLDKTDEYDYTKFIDSILPEQISQYFIVDGDRFKHFTKPTTDETKEAIEQLLKLKILDRASDHLLKVKQNLLIDKKRKYKNSVSNDFKKKYEGYVEDREKLKESISTITKNVARASNELHMFNSKIIDSTNSIKYQEEIDLLTKEIKRFEDSKISWLSELSDGMKYSYLFFLTETFLKVYTELDNKRIKGQGQYPFNKIFYEDLLAECNSKGQVKCICGREIKPEDKHYKNLEKLLKDIPSQSLTDMIQPLQAELKNAMINVQEVSKKITLYRNRIDEFDARIQTNTKRVNELSEKIDSRALANEPALQKSIYDTRKHLESIRLDLGIKEKELEDLDKKIKEYEKKIKQTTKIDLRSKKLLKKIEIVEGSLAALENEYDKFRFKIRVELEKAVSQILIPLFTAGERFKKFSIDEDYNYDVITLENESWKSLLSAAQRKLLGFSFVAGLRLVAEEDAPFIIDSPLGVIDVNHRKNYASQVPKLASQLVLFITDSELTEDVRNRLEPYVGAEWEIKYNVKQNRSSFTNLRK